MDDDDDIGRSVAVVAKEERGQTDRPTDGLKGAADWLNGQHEMIN